MKLIKMKKLILLILLILSSTVFYAQKELDSNKKDSIICLTLPEAKYFIEQNTKSEYLEKDNKDLIKKDSINTKQIGNFKNIIHNTDSIVNIQGRIITDKSNLINLEELKINSLEKKSGKKIKNRNIILGYSTLIIIFETIFIIFTIK